MLLGVLRDRFAGFAHQAHRLGVLHARPVDRPSCLLLRERAYPIDLDRLPGVLGARPLEVEELPSGQHVNDVKRLARQFAELRCLPYDLRCVVRSVCGDDDHGWPTHTTYF